MKGAIIVAATMLLLLAVGCQNKGAAARPATYLRPQIVAAAIDSDTLYVVTGEGDVFSQSTHAKAGTPPQFRFNMWAKRFTYGQP